MCILVTVLKMRPHYSKPILENATPSSGTSPLASYKRVTPPPRVISKPNLIDFWLFPFFLFPFSIFLRQRYCNLLSVHKSLTVQY